MNQHFEFTKYELELLPAYFAAEIARYNHCIKEQEKWLEHKRDDLKEMIKSVKETEDGITRLRGIVKGLEASLERLKQQD